MIRKKFFIVLGFVFFILGTIGIIIPLLPTTPFYILSAYLFGKSSKKCHEFLLNNKVFGKYIKDYQEKRGITLKNKINAIIFLSLSIGFSFYKTENIHAKIFLVIVFICVVFHITKLHTLK